MDSAFLWYGKTVSHGCFFSSAGIESLTCLLGNKECYKEQHLFVEEKLSVSLGS